MNIRFCQNVFKNLSYAVYFWILISQGWTQEVTTETSQKIPQRLTLQEAILKNLLQQPAIRVALANIIIQQGIVQSNAGPFDPIVNSSAVHTHSRDLIDPPITAPSFLPITPTTGTFAPIESPLSLNGLGLTDPTTLVEVKGSHISSISNVSNSVDTSELAATIELVPTIVHTHLKSNENNVHLDVSKLTRHGTFVIFNLDMDQVKNPLDSPMKLSAASATLGMVQPTLRGFYESLNRMTELASMEELSAVKLDTLQTISQQIFMTVGAYWDVVADKELIGVQKASEERLREIVESVKILIQKDVLAESDILQPIAQLTSQIATRINAEQTYYAAAQMLKFFIGEFDETCYCKENDFLAVDKFAEFSFISPCGFLESICKLFPLAFNRRFDILASTAREDEFVLLLKGAKNSELPRLDVVGRATWTDFKKNSQAKPFFKSLELDKPQLDLSIGVVFSTPFFRDEARGLIRQRQGQWAQAQANTQELKQKAMADINTAYKNQIALQEELKKTKEAVEEYTQLIADEKVKIQAGYGNIFYLLSYEATLTETQANYVNLQRSIAQNIANIRFLTGTLIKITPKETFLVEDATTIPFQEACDVF